VRVEAAVEGLRADACRTPFVILPERPAAPPERPKKAFAHYMGCYPAATGVTNLHMREDSATILHESTNSVDAISRLVSNAVPDEDVRTTLREEWLARNVECLHLGIAEAGPVFRLAGVLEGRNMGAQRVALASWLSSGAVIGLAPVQVSANFAPLGDKRWRCLHPCHAACEAPIASGSQTFHRKRYHAVAAAAAAEVLLESDAPPAVSPSAAGPTSPLDQQRNSPEHRSVYSGP
jgi:hypothetical protein